jgi:hypothetical protein
MQLEAEIDELVNAFQALGGGKIPISLITFAKLHSILKNVTLALPAGYELVMGSHYSQLPWYHANVRAAMLADSHSFMLMISLPLTTEDRKFQVMRLLAFPKRISNGAYVKFQINDKYLAVNSFHQTYFTLTDYELSQCKGDNIKVCAANKPILSGDTKHNQCVFQLYLNSDEAAGVCSRLISAHPPSPMMQRHGAMVVYFMPEPLQIFLRCRDDQGWNTTSLILEGVGTLSKVQTCHITAGNMKLYAELSGKSKVRTQSPLIMSPGYQTLTSHSEVEALKKIAENPNTYELLSTLSAHKMEPSVDTLLSLHTSLTHSHGLSWPTIVYISATVSICVMVAYHCSLTLVSKLKKRFINRNPRRTGARDTPGDDAHMSTQESTQASNPSPAHPASTTLFTVHGSTTQ